MSGHSKWSTIKRKKGALDIQRSKAFTRIVKEITVAVKHGGPDPDSNPRLRLAIQNAKGINMPKDNIQKAISKGSSDGDDYVSVTYEGNWIKGSSFIIECMTNNQTRTVAEVRAVFNRNGGTLGKNGSVSFNYERKSLFTIARGNISDLDSFLMDIIEFGGEDVEESEDNKLCVVGASTSFGDLQTFFENNNIEIKEARLSYFTINPLTLSKDEQERVLSFIEALESLDDVQYVYTNVVFDED